MSMDLSKEQMKERVVNYLEYMEEKDLQEIAATLYNLSKRRAEIRQRKENGGVRLDQARIHPQRTMVAMAEGIQPPSLEVGMAVRVHLCVGGC